MTSSSSWWFIPLLYISACIMSTSLATHSVILLFFLQPLAFIYSGFGNLMESTSWFLSVSLCASKVLYHVCVSLLNALRRSNQDRSPTSCREHPVSQGSYAMTRHTTDHRPVWCCLPSFDVGANHWPSQLCSQARSPQPRVRTSLCLCSSETGYGFKWH